MSEISTSIIEAISKRAASATLGTYLFFWVAYHWQGIYTTLFVNQDLIYKTQGGLLKNEYVNKYFFGIHGWNDWHFYFGIVVPALLTYILIRWMPYVLLKMYKWEQWFKVEKRIVKIDQEKKLQEDRKELAKEKVETIKEETKVVQAQNKAKTINPKILWEEEFSKLKTKERRLFGEILKAVYRYRGQVYVSGKFANYPDFELNPNALRLGDSLELVKLIEKGTRLELTDKGKYFANRYEGDI